MVFNNSANSPCLESKFAVFGEQIRRVWRANSPCLESKFAVFASLFVVSRKTFPCQAAAKGIGPAFMEEMPPGSIVSYFREAPQKSRYVSCDVSSRGQATVYFTTSFLPLMIYVPAGSPESDVAERRTSCPCKLYMSCGLDSLTITASMALTTPLMVSFPET